MHLYSAFIDLMELRMEPPTFRFVDNPHEPLSHCHPDTLFNHKLSIYDTLFIHKENLCP